MSKEQNSGTERNLESLAINLRGQSHGEPIKTNKPIPPSTSAQLPRTRDSKQNLGVPQGLP